MNNNCKITRVDDFVFYEKLSYCFYAIILIIRASINHKEKHLNEQIVEGSYKKGVCKNVRSQRKRVYRQKDAF